MADAGTLFSLGMVLVLFGVMIIILAFFLSFFKKSGGDRISAGGAVIIGPVPIVFGTDKKALKTVLSLSIVLTVFLLVVMIVGYMLR